MTSDNDEFARLIAENVVRALAAKPVIQPEWLPTKIAAVYLSVDPDYLQSLRAKGIGPKWSRPRGAQRVVRYKRSDLDAWMAAEDGGSNG